MKFAVSPFAPDRFPHLPVVGGLSAAVASRGFYTAAGLQRDDVFLIAFDQGTTCAGVFTRSTTASADVDWCRTALKFSGGEARALLVNAGNSNAFTGPKGAEKNEASLKMLTRTLQVPKDQCFLAATGVIGEPLPDPNFVGQIVPELAGRMRQPDFEALARAFMTTDTYPKGAGETVMLDDHPVAISGIAKGSGMIAPNMATMLAYIFTDAAVSPAVLDALIREICDETFNAITVDGDTSTSDTFMVFATGASGAPAITSVADPRLQALRTGLRRVATDLALAVVKDGEGATKFVTITVAGAPSRADARAIAAAVGNSPLVKTALAAGDANWGRIVMAIGKADVPVRQERLSIWFGDLQVADRGARAADYNEAMASAICAEPEIQIRIVLGDGPGAFTLYTCDLTHAYIDINGAYRT
ncbi:MAG: bifunctional glutamate N-acetyltransferase/amino-acid acetyltransferase ArgJ [Pseudomonadota bacterium]